MGMLFLCSTEGSYTVITSSVSAGSSSVDSNPELQRERSLSGGGGLQFKLPLCQYNSEDTASSSLMPTRDGSDSLCHDCVPFPQWWSDVTVERSSRERPGVLGGGFVRAAVSAGTHPAQQQPHPQPAVP